MTPNRKFILEQLASDPSELIETLRCAASALQGSSGFGADVERVVGLQMAPKLLALAQYLCAHDRVCPDHRCRYCSLLMAGVE
jgi:hypothetical protein